MSDLIDRQEIIDALDHVINNGAKNKYFDGHFITAEAMKEYILALPSTQPETPSNGSITCINPEKTHVRTTDDLISRQDAIIAVRSHRIDINDPKKIVRKSYEDVIRELPSAQPEIIRCGQCKYAEIADPKDNQDGYTCQFHKGSIWFSGSYCSWAERREDERNDI